MRNDIDQTQVNADELYDLVLLAMKAKLVPMVTSSPGIGKSAIMKKIANDMNLMLIDVRLSTAEPTHIGGLPFMVGDKAKLMPFNELFPTEDVQIPLNHKGKPYAGFLLFLDEITSANRATQAAAYQLVLDRMVGTKKLHPRVVIAAAGNKLDDRAVVNPMSTALQSRMVHLSLVPNVDVWAKNVAIPENYDPRITAFLHAYPNYLMNFDPNHEEKTFAAPRTWSFANSILKAAGKRSISSLVPILAGTISGSVASKFIAFCDNMHEVTPLKDVLADPENASIPAQSQYKWATVISLVQNLNKDTLAPICQYINRYTLPMQIIFYRSMVIHHKEFLSTPEFVRGAQLIGQVQV